VVHWSGRWRDVAGAARLAGLIRARKPAIVHLHSGGLVPRMITRASSNARVVMHYHSLSQESGKTLRRPTLTDLIIANSRATAETVAGAEPLVVYAGVDIAPRVQRRPRTERITLGTAARLVPVKGIGALLSVMKVVVSESPHVRLEIAGDGPERQSLTRHAEELGISRNVRFLGWRENVRDVMRGWDLYVQPSLAEGLGVAVLEAMAEGLPVIASRVGGLGEIVLDGTTGRLVGAEGSLATRINELVADESLRTRMGTAGREHVARNFSSEKEAAAIFNAYDKLLA